MRAPLFLMNTAWQSIWQHKGRSLLTVLSIIVGIAAMIATMAIGRGAQEKIRRRIASMGSNVLHIYTGGIGQSGATKVSRKKNTKWLRVYDGAYLADISCDVRHTAAFCRTQNKLLTFAGQKILAPIESCEQDSLSLNNRKIQYGRSFLTEEMSSRSRVAVLGASAAQHLFKSTPPLGKTVTIASHPFVVIGILEKVENFGAFNDRNMEVFVPLTTGKKLFHPYLPQTAVHGFSVTVQPNADTRKIERSFRRALRARHQLEKNDPDDFTIWSQSAMAAAAEQSSQTFNLFLLIVASLSLLVGGIGVSNIMLVSVTERTKEIGIRLALGASPGMIMAQFLVESVMLCSIGGVLGVCIGVTAPHLVTLITDWLVIVTPLSIIMSVLMTILLGLFFGFWPARKAARMNVVEALYD